MKFSESWLREWVNPAVTTQEIVDTLTMAGLEVDAVDGVAGSFSSVIVGEIIEAYQHPDADKLRVCTVSGAADGPKQVVCGAANARVGIKIPFAQVGAKLPPGEDGKPFKIKKAKLRGVESFGMLCGQTELLAGDDDSGLWELPKDIEVGVDLRDALSLNDKVIDVDLTPNRGDCLSIKGLAREAGVLFQSDVNNISPEPINVTEGIAQPRVTVTSHDACPRYCAVSICGVDISQPSPNWLQEKLRRSGVRSIDAVVDITNYVLLELGQPMHAFDADKVQGGLNVRLAKKGERLILLNDQEIVLNTETLVIADNTGAIALAGVMGGKSTSVSSETTNVILESAHFSPITIAGKAREYGLHTDSSHRFERGVDFNLPTEALARACELFTGSVGGQFSNVTIVENTDLLPTERDVTLTKQAILSGLGVSIEPSKVEDILSRLGLTLIASDTEGWIWRVPSYRFDITIAADLVEELARVYGYNNIPTRALRLESTLPSKPESALNVDTLKDQLVSHGYREAITYSFIDPKMHQLLFSDQPFVNVMNPISQDMSVMRTSLIPGLLSALEHNIKRQSARVRLFEAGMCFVQPGGATQNALDTLSQHRKIAGLAYGERFEADWHKESRESDFYDVKGTVEALISLTKETPVFEPAHHYAFLHPGQTAQVTLQGEEAGYIGALHPSIASKLDINKPVFVFELNLDALLRTAMPVYSHVSKFPEVSRDLAVIVDKSVPSASLNDEIRSKAGSYLKLLKVFDVYSGKGIDFERKSVAFNLIFQHPSRTLTEEEINAPMASIVDHLEETYNAQLR